MRKRLSLTSLLLISIIWGCNGTVNSKRATTFRTIQKTDSCITNTKNSYEIYIPKRTNSNEKFPLLIILDAHGDGKSALEKFIPAASEYNIILAASNAVKNGHEDYQYTIQELIADIQKKYPLNTSIYITGFSGGSRMALAYATKHPVNGLLLCGALGTREQITSISCPIVSVSGTDDFNFIETAQYILQEETCPSNLHIELTDDSHSWPDKNMLVSTLGYLLIGKNSPQSAFQRFRFKQQMRLDSLSRKNDLIKVETISRDMALNPYFDDNQKYEELHELLLKSPAYIFQINRLSNYLNQEVALWQTYTEAFSSESEDWWEKEIASNEEKIRLAKNPLQKDLYLRVKGFLGINCYSYCKRAIAQQNAAMLHKMLVIYKAIEPNNTDMLYFSAFIPFWEDNSTATIEALKKATRAGFSDLAELRADFPENISSKVSLTK